MTCLRLGALALAGLLITACGPRQPDDQTTDEVRTDATGEVMPTAPTWTANLSGTGSAAPATRPGATIEGNARVEMGDSREQSRVSVHLTGLQEGTYPWHVHSGTCDSGGPIVGPADAYPPLTVGADGMAQVEARIPIETPASGEYHVNIHRSPTDLATIVACGDLNTAR